MRTRGYLCYAHYLYVYYQRKSHKGTRLWKKEGLPNHNLDRKEYERRKLKIRSGVYAGIASIVRKGERYKAALIISPKEKDGLPKIEAHLLGFTDVLYNKDIELSFTKYLRPFMSFTKEDVLKRQIVKDIKQVEKIIELTQ